MMRMKVICILLICIVFTGCMEYGEKRIVKLITVNNETIAVYFYDYSQDKKKKKKEEKDNTGIENTITELLSEYDYDLKLCKYAVCDTSVVNSETEAIYNALMKSKFSPDIVILEGNTDENCEKYIRLKEKNYPVYSYRVDGTVTGIVEKTDNNEKNVIINSQLYRVLNTEQSFVFDIINNRLSKGTYIFEYKNNVYSAQLDGISAYYFVDNKNLNVNISATLKSYKGMASNEHEKEGIKEFIKNSIANNAGDLIEDKKLADEMRLMWYRKVEDFDRVKFNIIIL